MTSPSSITHRSQRRFRARWACSAVALATTAALSLSGPAAAAPSGEPKLPRASAAATGDAGVIVRFRADAGRRERSLARRRAGTRLEERLPLAGLQLVEGPRPSEVAQTIAELERSPGVSYAEPDLRRTATAPPDDTYFDRLWGLENRGGWISGDRATSDADIDAPAAWRLTTGSLGVKVAVIDTGIDAGHPELAPNLWTNSGEAARTLRSNGRDDDGNGRRDDVHGWDFVSDDRNPDDDHGHGTHVAGTVAARGGNRRGVAGVAWRARIMPLKVLDDDARGKLSNVIKAYRYAAANGARVVNVSLGGDPPARSEREAIAAARDTLFVIAAGNESDDNDDPGDAHYPCSYPLPNIVCVAASTPADRLAEFSNFGRRSVDLAAPGRRILSTQPGNDYGVWSGTSMAAPHVAGAATLILAVRPGLSVTRVKAALMSSSERRSALTGRTVTGGRLNARRAIDLARRLP